MAFDPTCKDCSAVHYACILHEEPDDGMMAPCSLATASLVPCRGMHARGDDDLWRCEAHDPAVRKMREEQDAQQAAYLAEVLEYDLACDLCERHEKHQIKRDDFRGIESFPGWTTNVSVRFPEHTFDACPTCSADEATLTAAMQTKAEALPSAVPPPDFVIDRLRYIMEWLPAVVVYSAGTAVACRDLAKADQIMAAYDLPGDGEGGAFGDFNPLAIDDGNTLICFNLTEEIQALGAIAVCRVCRPEDLDALSGIARHSPTEVFGGGEGHDLRMMNAGLAARALRGRDAYLRARLASWSKEGN